MTATKVNPTIDSTQFVIHLNHLSFDSKMSFLTHELLNQLSGSLLNCQPIVRINPIFDLTRLKPDSTRLCIQTRLDPNRLYRKS